MQGGQPEGQPPHRETYAVWKIPMTNGLCR